MPHVVELPSHQGEKQSFQNQLLFLFDNEVCKIII
jgi:hypothetical protein